ncbi:hypothetical protein BHE74_00059738, partial [Ensete ventricosum]
MHCAYRPVSVPTKCRYFGMDRYIGNGRFNRRRLISGDISEEGKQKKREKKNLESVDSSLVRSVARGRFLLPVRGEGTTQ